MTSVKKTYVIPSTLNKQQSYAVRQLEGPLTIAAGAGSGKTFTLTQRLAHALAIDTAETPEDVDELLAITFTNKAAGELIARVRRELRSAGMNEQALGIDGAWISTIHGMCSRMLRAHALDIGIDPAFEVLDEARANILKQDAFARMLEDARQDPRFEKLLAELKGRKIFELISTLREQLSILPEGTKGICAGPGGEDVSDIARALIRSTRELRCAYGEYAENELAEEANAGLTELAAAAEQAIEIAENGESDDALNLLREALDGYYTVAKNRAGAKPIKPLIDNEREIFLLLRARVAAAHQHEQALLLIELAAKTQDIYGQLKQAASALDNNDLLLMTYRLLEDNPDIAAEYRSQFKLVMVDEFQDTSQLQIDTIKLICSSSLGTFCTVGDEQQSIYAFRGADVDVYRKHKTELADKGHPPLEFALNYRSHPDILTIVNTLFAQPGMFGKELLGLAAGRDESKVKHVLPEGFPRLDMLMCEGDGGGSDLMCVFEARYIALRFSQLVWAGMEPGDMVILLRSTKNIDVYARAVRSFGLPCIATGGSNYFTYDEVAILSRLLNVFANPHDEESLLIVLASPLFEITDDDLLELRKRRVELRAYNKKASYFDALMNVYVATEPGEEDSRLYRASQQLHRSLVLARTAPLDQVLWGALEDSPWDRELLARGIDGNTLYANIIKFIDMVALEQERSGSTIVDIAARFSSACDMQDEREKAGILIGDEVNAVRILTIHASKGLEFPVVALGGFFGDGGHATTLVKTQERGKVHVGLMPCGDWFDNGLDKKQVADALKDFSKAYDQPTDSGEPQQSTQVELSHADELTHTSSIRLKAGLAEAEEKNRLLYVALTRAQEALIVGVTNRYSAARSIEKPGLMVEMARAFFDGAFPEMRTASFALDGSGVVKDEGGSSFVEAPYCPTGFGCYTHFVFKKDDAGMRGPVFADEAEEEAWSRAVGAVSDGEAFETENAFAAQPLTQFSFGPLVLEPDSTCIRTQFSYSALAKGGAKAGRFACEPDEKEEDVDASGSVADEDQDACRVPANIFGTAFHTLAQVLAQLRERAQLPQEAVDALCERYGFDEVTRKRLVDAAEAWMSSELCERAFAFDVLQPEMPFNLHIQEDFNLEGSIDLFCRNNDANKGLIVDYKTGSSTGEEDERGLEGRYLLQATCYAYAALVAGLDSVDVVFIRPEVLHNEQPQEIAYRFERRSQAEMRETICAARA